MLTCSVSGCCRSTLSSGTRKLKGNDVNTVLYCRKHLQWLRKYGTTEMPRYAQGSLSDRFWKFVDKTDYCWLWNGAKQKKGYGLIQDATKIVGKQGKTLLAHRVSYQLHNGDLQDGDYVLHSCDNPSCVNPAHLRRGACSENIKEAFDKGRKQPLILVGVANPKSKLTEEQVRFIKANPQLGHKAIGDMFGLSPNCIRGVRIGRTWTHI